MPEDDYAWLPREDILHFEEISALVDVFVAQGIDKVRLTGGEPLMRRDLPNLVRMLAAKSGLTDLAEENYQTLMKNERAKNAWTSQQLLMINALHMFSASYFSGNVKISAQSDASTDAGAAEGATAASKGAAAPATGSDQAAAGTDIIVPKKPTCPPEQKQKVINSINAYVQAAKVAPPRVN